MSRPRAVVFDVGGVLIECDYRVPCRELFDDDAEVDYFLDEVLGAEFHRERDRGVPTADLLEQWSRRHPSYAPHIATFSERVPETWIGPVPGSAEVLTELKAAGVGVYGLTNWGAETWPVACERFDVLGAFDDVLVSGFVGLTKPDVAIYELFCERFGVVPAESVFVDDVEANVVAARSLGFHGIVFRDAEDLRRALVRCGLLDEPPASARLRTGG